MQWVLVSEAAKLAGLTRQRVNQMVLENKVGWKWGKSDQTSTRVRLVRLEDVLSRRRNKPE